MIREYVYQACLGNSFNLCTFGSADLERIFYQYDALCFRYDFGRRSNRRIKFMCSSRQGGALGDFQVGRADIVIDVAPRAISAEFLRNPLKFKLLGGDPCGTEGYALLVIVEHILIHLLVEMFASHNSKGEIVEFFRLAQHHFSHPVPPPGRGKCTWRSNQCILVPIQLPTTFYQLQQNSCYLDTILMIILGGGAPAWRETIFIEDVNHTDYGQVLSAFPAAASTARVRAVAYQLQTSLFDDYSVIFSHDSTGSLTSSSIRECFASMLPGMKLGEGWAPFSASAIYDLLADFFPGLKTQCPVRIVKGGATTSVQTRPRNLLQMWDYMDPLTDTEGSYEEILWDEIESPMLVFQNGSHPPIREFDRLQPEIVVADNTRKTVYKQRVFGETILGGRYRLSGVVTLVGGAHYIGYIRIAGDWYYYNDTGPVFRVLKDLPREGVWKESGGAKPDLLFYFLDSG